MMTFANRIGITIAEHGFGRSGSTEVERYIKKSGLLTDKSEKIRLDVIPKGSDEPRLIEGIKKLISYETVKNFLA